MSVQALSWVLDHSKSRLAARLVLLSIANHANEVGDNAWPSVSRIAREAHVTDRQVQRALVGLVGLGELLIIHGAGPGGAHVYQVCMGGDKLSPGGVTNRTEGGDISYSAIRMNRPEPSKALTPLPPLKRGVCEKHPKSGLTPKGNCWGCYEETHSSATAD